MRLRRRGFSRGSRREPGIWVRQNISIGSADIATQLAITVADPSLLPAVAGTDQRYTLTRLMLSIAPEVQVTTPAATIQGDSWRVATGLFFDAPSESPNVLSVVPTTDWLYLANGLIPAGINGVQVISALGIIRDLYTRNQHNTPGFLDLKTKRKCDADEVVRLIIRFDGAEIFATGHNIVAATPAAFRIISSSFWKRTLR